jgi:dihydroorotate dehydrogenase electron transfer subunit
MPKIGPSSAGKKQNKLSPLPNGVQFIPVTEDGSMGQKGRATDILPDFLDWADQVYACGPVDMYKAMAKMSLRAKRSNLKLTKCQVSLEVRMGCGFGACYGCTINTQKGLKHICRDGPVFELDDIIWQEVRI